MSQIHDKMFHVSDKLLEFFHKEKKTVIKYYKCPAGVENFWRIVASFQLIVASFR